MPPAVKQMRASESVALATYRIAILHGGAYNADKITDGPAQRLGESVV